MGTDSSASRSLERAIIGPAVVIVVQNATPQVLPAGFDQSCLPAYLPKAALPLVMIEANGLPIIGISACSRIFRHDRPNSAYRSPRPAAVVPTTRQSAIAIIVHPGGACSPLSAVVHARLLRPLGKMDRASFMKPPGRAENAGDYRDRRAHLS